MRVDLKARVFTEDGEEVGSVVQAIVDPATGDVADFVVTTGGLYGRDILVPREVLERAAREKDGLKLALTLEELDDLPDYDPEDYTPPPSEWNAPADLGYPTESYLWPDSEGAPQLPPGIAKKEPPQDAIKVEKGASVVDVKGEEVGVVEELRLAHDSGHITGVVIKVGNPIQKLLDSEETVEIGAGTIDRVEENVVHLNAARDRIDIGKKK